MGKRKRKKTGPIRRLRYAMGRWRLKYVRFLAHFDASLLAGSSILTTLTGIGAVVCAVVLVVYVGYNLTPTDMRLLKRILRVIQLLFTLNILYHLVLLFKTTIRESRVIKWIVDLGILASVLFWLMPWVPRTLWPSAARALTGNAFMFVALGAYSVVDLCYTLSRIPGRRTNPSLLMASSFLVFIIMGSFLLMLPRCTYHGISYFDSLFVASSAVSITGLTSVDIPTTFTPLGILVLSVLIQLGSLGIITFTSFFAMFFTGTTSIYNQLLLRDVVYSKSMNSLIPTLLYVLGFTLTIEITGAVIVYFTIPDSAGLDLNGKLMFSAFHAMSSFCNAGFSSMPDGMANPVFMQSNQLIYIVTSVLIFAGAVGFPILVNLKEILGHYVHKMWAKIKGQKAKEMRVHIFDLNTKLVLYTTLTVLAVGTTAFLMLEWNNTLQGMSVYKKVVQAVFNSLVPRSAGFASVNPASFLDVTLLLVIVQMIIGGASQSMAGGIKVNTLGAVVLNLRAVLHGHRRATAFHRTINQASIRRANAVIVISATALIIYLIVMLLLEPGLGTKDVVFEVVSALFTVGSSLGITGELCDASKVVLSSAMFLGRVGLLSLIAGLLNSTRDVSDHYPVDNIIIN